MPNLEQIKRLVQISTLAEKDNVDPTVYIKRAMRLAISYGNPLIKLDDPFVVLGVDGSRGDIFPCGSFTDVGRARKLAKKKIDEEYLFSDGDEISTTFHIFTNDGVHIPLESTNDPE